MMWQAIFWLSFSLICYHIFAYPLLLFILNHLRKSNTLNLSITDDNYPSITIVCPAYNEEDSIEDKIKSFLSLDYPRDLIKMIIVSDDSTDMTNEIVKKYLGNNVELIIQKPRKGKQQAHNLIQPCLTSEYVLSTDANSIFEPDAIRVLVKTMQSDPNIGLVSGELKLIKKSNKDSGEGLYWKYECFIKKMDSAFASIIGANGSIYLIRRDLFRQIHPQTIDDFERTLITLKYGFKAIYEPDAIVSEFVTEKVKDEISRKIRIINREWFALKRNLVLLNPFKHGRISFILFSHKLLRWFFFIFAISILISSAILPTYFYHSLFIIQVVFYLVGIAELVLQRQGKHIPGTGIVAYITAMIWVSFVAFIMFIRNNRTSIWNPIRKQGS